MHIKNSDFSGYSGSVAHFGHPYGLRSNLRRKPTSESPKRLSLTMRETALRRRLTPEIIGHLKRRP